MFSFVDLCARFLRHAIFIVSQCFSFAFGPMNLRTSPKNFKEISLEKQSNTEAP